MAPIIGAVLWDIFCKVIDNHGDIGVCWRLSAELAARGQQVRLWVDDGAALAWMAPGPRHGVEVIDWVEPAPALEPADAVVEAFGCDPPPGYLAALAGRSRSSGRQPPWLNLEYLSAEAYVERCHGLPSPVSCGPAAGLTKRFFYPGFTPRTGGLLREQDLLARQAAHDSKAWLLRRGIVPPPEALCISLFCYEPPALEALLQQLRDGPRPTVLLVTAGRAQAAVRSLGLAPGAHGRLSLHELPLMSQREYDELLWSCDLNFVRGEDSFVRALWAGRAFVWQPYPQSDGAHAAKLEAFLDWLGAPPSLRSFHRGWCGLDPARRPLLPALEPEAWAEAAASARSRALALPELTAGLLLHAEHQATI